MMGKVKNQRFCVVNNLQNPLDFRALLLRTFNLVFLKFGWFQRYADEFRYVLNLESLPFGHIMFSASYVIRPGVLSSNTYK
jgi:hypothetical protein